MSSQSIRIFNPFDLCPPPYSEDKWMVQEVIFYCESRFRCALQAMTRTAEDNLRWMQRCLRSELVCLCYSSGMAMALGQVVDVPIVLRSLAADFYANPESESPLSFDMDFLLMLDSAPEKGSPSELVELYYMPWWNQNGLQDRPTLMNNTNIDKCLSQYWKQIKRMRIPVPSASIPLTSVLSASVLSTSVPASFVVPLSSNFGQA